MPRSLPRSVSDLLSATNPATRERAWATFSREYSKLILHTCHKYAAGYDDAMDRYAFALERLRADEGRRLGTYDPARKARFTTWLVAVVSRLCTDFHREKYGRARSQPNSNEPGPDWVDVRSRLVDMVAEHLNLDTIPDVEHRSPEGELLEGELQDALGATLSGLDDRDQLLLAMRFEDGQTATAIAATMGFKSQFHVYRKLRTVLGNLKEALEARGFSGSA